MRFAQAELFDRCLGGLADVIALDSPFAGGFFVLFGLGVLHGDSLVWTLGAAGCAGRMTASVVAWASPALAPAVGAPPGDGLVVGELVDGDELLGDGDVVRLGEVVGVGNVEGPGRITGGHGLLDLRPAGAVLPPVPLLANGELEPPFKPLPPLGPPPGPGPCCWLFPLGVDTTAGILNAAYAPTATMNTATPKAASGRSKLHTEDLPARASWAAGSGRSDRNHWEIVRSVPEAGSGTPRNRSETERSLPAT